MGAAERVGAARERTRGGATGVFALAAAPDGVGRRRDGRATGRATGWEDERWVRGAGETGEGGVEGERGCAWVVRRGGARGVRARRRVRVFARRRGILDAKTERSARGVHVRARGGWMSVRGSVSVSRLARWRGGGAATEETVALEPPRAIEKEINFLDRDLMVKLRKKAYDFTRADSIVKDVLGQMSAETQAAAKDDGAAESAPKRAKVAAADDDDATQAGAFTKVREGEKKKIDFKDKLYLAPLTTVGNLPFRRVCKTLGADVTCGEMALVTNLLQGQPSEWALLRRHKSEDIFGVQICGGYPDTVTRCCQLLEENIDVDFIDINMGCPIDLVCQKGYGSMMLEKPKNIEKVLRAASAALTTTSLTFKTRIAYTDSSRVAHTLSPKVAGWGATAMTLHGRTRAQRYRSVADWEYIKLTKEVSSVPLIGNGDVYMQSDYYTHMAEHSVDTCMLARGALIKPWLFTEIKERRDWDISSSERFDILKSFVSHGLEHWGCDSRGVENTRKYLLEWMSFTCRYTPLGILEQGYEQVDMTQRPPHFVGRDDLETLMASTDARDWVKISTMLLGPPPENFNFQPKHKSNAYATEGGAALGDMDQG